MFRVGAPLAADVNHGDDLAVVGLIHPDETAAFQRFAPESAQQAHRAETIGAEGRLLQNVSPAPKFTRVSAPRPCATDRPIRNAAAVNQKLPPIPVCSD